MSRTRARSQKRSSWGRRPLGSRLFGALISMAIILSWAWAFGGLVAVLGAPLWESWVGAALMFPLLPLLMRVTFGARAPVIPVSIALALVGLIASFLWSRAELKSAVTDRAGWMFESADDAATVDTSTAEPPESAPGPFVAPPAPPPTAPPTPPTPPTPPAPPAQGRVPAPTEGEPQPDKGTAHDVEDAASKCFREHVRTESNGSAYDVNLADMNGDSALDLVWVNSGRSDEHSIEVAAGSRDGTFSPLTSTPYAGGGLSVAIADLDHDGNLDVATPDYDGGTITVWTGGGDGTLRQSTVQKTFRKPFDILAADLNADGNADLVVNHYFHLEVMRGDGKGELRTTPWLRLEKVPGAPKRLLTPEGIAAADLTGNGLLELVVPKGDVETIEVWRTNKRGKFQRSAIVDSCPAPSNAQVGNVIGEGFADVLVHCGDGTVELLEGDGAGGLVRRGAVGPETSLSGIALADLTGDGRLDLLTPTARVGNYGGASTDGPAALQVYAGDGKGGFLLRHTEPLEGLQHRLLGTTDVDGDGLKDLVYQCFGQSPGSHFAVAFGTGCP